VFAYPLNPERDFVKRVIAVAARRCSAQQTTLRGQAAGAAPAGGKNTDHETLSSVFSNRDNVGPVIVPQGSLFRNG